MPSNQIDVNVSIDTPQADVAALAKLTEALKSIPGAQGGGGGRIQQTFGTAADAGQFAREQMAAQKAFGGQLTGVAVRASEGRFTTSADVNGNGDQKKAFSPGGAIASIATGVGVAIGMLKPLLGMSKIFQTFMGTTGKILATAVDLMLAPLMPIFMRIMVWLIQKVFPIAIKIGNWLDNMGPVGAAATLVGGYVALKFGPKILVEAGKSIGAAMINKMNWGAFGTNIASSMTKAVDLLKGWGGSIGTFIVDGFKAGKTAMVLIGTAIGNAITAAYVGSRAAMMRLAVALGIGQAGGFIGMTAAMKLVGRGIGIAMGLGFQGMRAVFILLGTAIGVAMGGGFTGSNLAMTALSTRLGIAMAGGFTGMRGAMVVVGRAIGIGQAGGFLGMRGAMVAVGRAIGIGQAGGFLGMRGAMVAVGRAIGIGQAGGFLGMKGAMLVVGRAIGIGQAGGFIGMRATMLLIGSAIGGRISLAFLGARLAMIGIGSSIGAKIGVAFGASSALGRASTWVGTAIAGAIRLSPAWVAIGGTVAAALGVATIGAAIGYAMWRSYKAHEAGKNIFEGKDVFETYKIIKEQYGIRPLPAYDLAQAVAGVGQTGPWADKISVTQKSFVDFIDTWKTVEEFTTLPKLPIGMYATAFKRLDQSEAEFIINQLKDLVTPERLASLYEIAAELGTVVSQVISVQGDVSGPSVLAGITESHTFDTFKSLYADPGLQHAAWFQRDIERQWREILNEIYEVTKYTEQTTTWLSRLPGNEKPWTIGADAISAQDREIAMSVLFFRNPEAALRLIDPAKLEELGWGEWGMSELDRSKRNNDVYNIVINMEGIWQGEIGILEKVIQILEFEKAAVTP